MKDIERMVVSAHEDGEVESPWKEKVEQRLASDPAWAAEARLHRDLKQKMSSSPEPDWTEASARVKARVLQSPKRSRLKTTPWAWASVAAAALLVLAAGGGYWAGRVAVPSSAPSDLAELQVQVPKSMGLKLSGEGQLLMASTLQRTTP